MQDSQKDKMSLVEEAYEILKQKICDFELYPGQVISDFTLSKELHMSRTPIRQALQLLENDGLIESAPSGKSYAVCQITSEDIEDLFNVRTCIEITSLKLAMSRDILTDEINTLIHINKMMEEANRNERVKQQFFFDQKFHNYIVSMSHNKRLIKINEGLLLQLTRMRVLSYLERPLQSKAYNDHNLVIECISKKDRDGAMVLLEKHIESTKVIYNDLLVKQIPLESYGILRFLMQDK